MTKKHKGHYCKICGEYKSNESFSGKGHAQHICKECMGEMKKGNKKILDLPFGDNEFEIVDADEYIDTILYGNNEERENKIITAKRKATAFKNEMCFPQTKTKCELKKHSNSKFECFFVILIEQRPVYFFLFLPSRFKTTLYVCLNSKSEGCQLFNIFECV